MLDVVLNLRNYSFSKTPCKGCEARGMQPSLTRPQTLTRPVQNNVPSPPIRAGMTNPKLAGRERETRGERHKNRKEVKAQKSQDKSRTLVDQHVPSADLGGRAAAASLLQDLVSDDDEGERKAAAEEQHHPGQQTPFVFHGKGQVLTE